MPTVTRVRHPFTLRRLVVQDVEDLSPTLRQVHLTGPALDGFASLGPTDHVKVAFGLDGADPVMPVIEDERWTNRGAPGLTVRDETVRAFDGTRLTLQLVAGDHGPAGRWAAQASAGQVLGVVGPRSSKIPPIDRERYLLACDETGVGALARWLELLPTTARVDALVEVDSAHHHVALPAHDGLHVAWLHRDDARTTATPPLAIAAMDLLGHPDPSTIWVWAAGEAAAVRALRTHATDHGLAESIAMTGYWRRGVADFDHHGPDA